MKKIYLRNKNAFAVVDDQDFEAYGGLAWHCNHNGYAVRRMGNPRKTTYLHRLITDCPKGMYVDHINRNRLDNRRDNLQVVDWATNRLNVSKHKDNKLGERNIDLMRGRYRVRVQRRKTPIVIGYYNTIKEAIHARDSYYARERV